MFENIETKDVGINARILLIIKKNGLTIDFLRIYGISHMESLQSYCN